MLKRKSAEANNLKRIFCRNKNSKSHPSRSAVRLRVKGSDLCVAQLLKSGRCHDDSCRNRGMTLKIFCLTLIYFLFKVAIENL